jgi:hypothetical protein
VFREVDYYDHGHGIAGVHRGTADDIAERACAMYFKRAYADGFDRDDWLRAERELKARPASRPEETRPGAGTRRSIDRCSHDEHLPSTI